MTKEEFAALASQVAGLAKKLETNKAEEKSNIDKMVKDILATSPAFSQNRDIQFETSSVGTQQERTDRILAKMPKELVKDLDDVFLVSLVLKRPVTSLGKWAQVKAELGDFKKALDTSTSGGVSEWIPTGFSTQFFELVRLETVVASLFPVIPMPRSPFDLPIGVGALNTFKGTEQTSDSPTKFPVSDTASLSGKTTLTAQKHVARVLVSKEAEEESVVAMLPFLRGELITAFANGREDAMLNGDTAGTHEDSDSNSATSRRKLWLGLRAHANNESYKQDLSTFNLTNLRVMRGNMGKYGVQPSQLAWIVGVKGMIKMLGLSEVVTLDKFGSAATVITGQIANLDGIPVVVSGQLREDLTPAGIFDGVTETKTVLHIVNRRGFVVGERRRFTQQLLTELYAESDQDALVATERLTFQDLYPIATNVITQMGHNFS